MSIRFAKPLSITFRHGEIRVRADAIAVGLFEGAKKPSGPTAALDRESEGAIGRVLSGGAFRGNRGEALVLLPSESPAARLVLVGLGKRDEVDAEGLRRAAATALREAARRGATSLVVSLFDAPGLSVSERARAVAEGCGLGAYRFDRYRTSDEEAPARMRRVTITSPNGEKGAAEAVRRGRIVADACNWTRELSNAAPGDLPPAALAGEARKLAKSRGLSCKVLTEAQIAKSGMRALLAVGQGSANPPRFIHLEYRPAKKAVASVALVGKGITFDTGGISLKPWSGMWDMKFDKCGATAALGGIRAAADLGLAVHVHAVVAAAENMPSGEAYRPGDVITTAAGKTVEVHSTDAEGRLVLADALHYAAAHKPDAIVDLATLTGACVVALGARAAGLFARDEKLGKALAEAGDSSGERVWPMPLFKEYRRQLDSKVADLKNVGGRKAGAVTAAKFLEEFAGDGAWAHLDIAGVADTDAKDGYHVPGATGFGARLLARWLEDVAVRR